ncbi:MAG TPA: ABC transporter ATP-binding protein [Polyangiaceae bacterium]
MSAELALVRASGVGKLFRLHGDVAGARTTLRETLASWMGGGKRRPKTLAYWALRDVSFEVRPGEVVGIVGHNGAGKSTLLRIVSRITEPTEGRVEVRGRVGSLLDVGTGFHLELTGRENIFLNGAILGMKRAEVARKFDEIVAFAGTEAFLDMPVKHYSTGMYMRLGFAVAAHLETDALLVDEVLAVGDAAFQKKCIGKMGEVARDGRAVLFVSHNLGAVRALCSRALVLAQGSVHFDGATDAAISHYLTHVAPSGEKDGEILFPPPGLTFGPLAIHAVRCLDDAGVVRALFDASERVRVGLDVETAGGLRGLHAVLRVSTHDGETAFQSAGAIAPDADLPPGRFHVSCAIPGGLLNGRAYVVEISLETPGSHEVAPRRPYVSFAISGAGGLGADTPEAWPGVVRPRLDWTVGRP